ncbi:unnamed protein product, partial [Closterium sp. NIES-53]
MSTPTPMGAQNQSVAAAAAGFSTSVSAVLSVFVILFIFLFFFVMVIRACLLVLNARDSRGPHDRTLTLEEHMMHRSQLGAMQKALTAGLDPEIVQTLPTVTFSREKLHEGCCESFRECAVCLGEYEDGECIKTLPSCGHRFHATCIDIWFCAHTTCPICRFNLKPPKHPSQQEGSQGRTSDAGDSGDSSERHATANDEEYPSTTVSETTADSVSIEVEIVDNIQQQHEIVEMDSSSEALARPPVVRAAAVAETGEADASSAAAAVVTAGTDASCELAGIRVPA